MGSSKAQTVGYRYKMGLHMCLCHGPVDEFMEIRAGDLTIWNGQRYGPPTPIVILARFLRGKDQTLPVTSTSPVVANEQIRIYAPTVFGGDDREGGVSGNLDVMMGGSAQTANSYLASKQAGPQPAYRGILSVVFRQGLVSSNNPYMKAWAFRLKRLLSGWDGSVWYSAKASIDLGGGIIAMNPAHIVYECFTNRRWGHGMNSSQLDLTSFAAAADTFYAEGMGLCIAWTQQETIDDFIQKIVNHVGAAVGEDPKTGLYRIKPLRGDYSLGSLEVFSLEEGNIVSIDNFDRAAVSDVKNEITVKFIDQATGKGSSVTVQNLASVQANGAPSADTMAYPGLPTKQLATRAALRDLKASTAGIARVRFVANRAAYGYLKGDVVAFSWPDQGVALMPLRIASIDYGSIADGRITIEGVQDVFGLPATTYISDQPTSWVEPSRTPQASTNFLVFEMPYRDLVRQLTNQTATGMDPEIGRLGSVALRAPGISFGYELDTRTGSNDYLLAENGEWTPTGTLVGAMTATTTSVTVTGFEDLDQVGFGSAAFIDDEMLRVDSYDPVTGACVFARGCGDTVPMPHSAGARVWFYETFEAMDPIEWATSEVVDAKIRTLSADNVLSIASSPGGSVTMSKRANRPYAPGKLRINTSAYPSSVTGGLTITWAHRDRILQQEQVVDTEASSIGPEGGVTYTIRYYDASTLVNSVAGLSSPTHSYIHYSDVASMRVEVESIRGGLGSRQFLQHTFAYTAPTLSGATWNSSDKSTDISLSGASRVMSRATGTTSAAPARSTVSYTTGKRYFEYLIVAKATAGGDIGMGLARAAHSLSQYIGQSVNSWGIWGNYAGVARRYHNNTFGGVSLPGALNVGTVVGVAVDLGTGGVWYSINGVWQEGDPVAGTGASHTNATGAGGAIFAAGDIWNAVGSIRLKSDPVELTYAAPSGFTAGW